MNSIDEQKMQFILTIRSKGVVDKNVLNALETVNRQHFLKGLFAQRAYEDTPLPIECGQAISQPSVVGLMTQALNIKSRDKVLEIGTGSGYQTARARTPCQTCSRLTTRIIIPVQQESSSLQLLLRTVK